MLISVNNYRDTYLSLDAFKCGIKHAGTARMCFI